jgi:hypothetical protein
MDEKIMKIITAKKAEIRAIKKELDKYDKDYENRNPIYRLEREIELLELGCTIEYCPHGTLVNGRFIVGHNKWCVKGKYKWYRYKDIPTFVAKYIDNF